MIADLETVLNDTGDRFSANNLRRIIQLMKSQGLVRSQAAAKRMILEHVSDNSANPVSAHVVNNILQGFNKRDIEKVIYATEKVYETLKLNFSEEEPPVFKERGSYQTWQPYVQGICNLCDIHGVGTAVLMDALDMVRSTAYLRIRNACDLSATDFDKLEEYVRNRARKFVNDTFTKWVTNHHLAGKAASWEYFQQSLAERESKTTAIATLYNWMVNGASDVVLALAQVVKEADKKLTSGNAQIKPEWRPAVPYQTWFPKMEDIKKFLDLSSVYETVLVVGSALNYSSISLVNKSKGGDLTAKRYDKLVDLTTTIKKAQQKSIDYLANNLVELDLTSNVQLAYRLIAQQFNHTFGKKITVDRLKKYRKGVMDSNFVLAARSARLARDRLIAGDYDGFDEKCFKIGHERWKPLFEKIEGYFQEADDPVLLAAEVFGCEKRAYSIVTRKQGSMKYATYLEYRKSYQIFKSTVSSWVYDILDKLVNDGHIQYFSRIQLLIRQLGEDGFSVDDNTMLSNILALGSVENKAKVYVSAYKLDKKIRNGDTGDIDPDLLAWIPFDRWNGVLLEYWNASNISSMEGVCERISSFIGYSKRTMNNKHYTKQSFPPSKYTRLLEEVEVVKGGYLTRLHMNISKLVEDTLVPSTEIAGDILAQQYTVDTAVTISGATVINAMYEENTPHSVGLLKSVQNLRNRLIKGDRKDFPQTWYPRLTYTELVPLIELFRVNVLMPERKSAVTFNEAELEASMRIAGNKDYLFSMRSRETRIPPSFLQSEKIREGQEQISAMVFPIENYRCEAVRREIARIIKMKLGATLDMNSLDVRLSELMGNTLSTMRWKRCIGQLGTLAYLELKKIEGLVTAYKPKYKNVEEYYQSVQQLEKLIRVKVANLSRNEYRSMVDDLWGKHQFRNRLAFLEFIKTHTGENPSMYNDSLDCAVERKRFEKVITFLREENLAEVLIKDTESDRVAPKRDYVIVLNDIARKFFLRGIGWINDYIFDSMSKKRLSRGSLYSDRIEVVSLYAYKKALTIQKMHPLVRFEGMGEHMLKGKDLVRFNKLNELVLKRYDISRSNLETVLAMEMLLTDSYDAMSEKEKQLVYQKAFDLAFARISFAEAEQLYQLSNMSNKYSENSFYQHAFDLEPDELRVGALKYSSDHTMLGIVKNITTISMAENMGIQIPEKYGRVGRMKITLEDVNGMEHRINGPKIWVKGDVILRKFHNRNFMDGYT